MTGNKVSPEKRTSRAFTKKVLWGALVCFLLYTVWVITQAVLKQAYEADVASTLTFNFHAISKYRLANEKLPPPDDWEKKVAQYKDHFIASDIAVTAVATCSGKWACEGKRSLINMPMLIVLKNVEPHSSVFVDDQFRMWTSCVQQSRALVDLSNAYYISGSGIVGQLSPKCSSLTELQ